MSGRVHQKLYFSKLLLERARVESGQVQLALPEGAVMHLAVAYRCHVAAIAAQYDQLLQSGEHAIELTQRLVQQGVDAAELNELATLEKKAWAGDLLRLAAATVAPADPDEERRPPTSSVGIAVLQLDAQSPAADPQHHIQQLSEWHADFSELVAAQHASLQEW
jgi:hypothetical protein